MKVKQVWVCAQDKRPLLFTSRLAAPGRGARERGRGDGEKNRGSHETVGALWALIGD